MSFGHCTTSVTDVIQLLSHSHSHSHSHIRTTRATDVTQSHSHSHYSVPQDTSSRCQSRVERDDGDTESFLNPAATPFLPVQSAEVTDNLDQTDEFLEHINLLYDTADSSNMLTHEANSQFSEMFNSHETVFASRSSDSGNCPVLEQNVVTPRNSNRFSKFLYRHALQ